MKRATTAYQRGKLFILHTSSCTIDGVWILTEPCIRLTMDCTDAELGNAVQSTLDASEINVPHPTDWDHGLEHLLSAAGVKSWSTFAKSALCVEIDAEGEELILTPTSNEGPSNGYEHSSQTLSISLPASNTVIGARLREAFLRAK